MEFLDLCSDVLFYFVEMLMQCNQNKSLVVLSRSCKRFNLIVNESIHHNKSQIWKYRHVHIRMIQSRAVIERVKALNCFSQDFGIGIVQDPRREGRDLKFIISSLWGACFHLSIPLFSGNMNKYQPNTLWCANNDEFCVHIHSTRVVLVIRVTEKFDVFYQLQEFNRKFLYSGHGLCEYFDAQVVPRKQYLCQDGTFASVLPKLCFPYLCVINHTPFQFCFQVENTFYNWHIIHFISSQPFKFKIYMIYRNNQALNQHFTFAPAIWQTSDGVYVSNYLGTHIYRLEFIEKPGIAKMVLHSHSTSFPLQCENELHLNISKLYTLNSFYKHRIYG